VDDESPCIKLLRGSVRLDLPFIGEFAANAFGLQNVTEAINPSIDSIMQTAAKLTQDFLSRLWIPAEAAPKFGPGRSGKHNTPRLHVLLDRDSATADPDRSHIHPFLSMFVFEW
jgi:hypothetical protein